MRKMILLIVVAFLATADSFAQSLWDSSLPDRRLSFGLTAGLNYASTDMDYANSVRPSFHAGATVDYAFVKSLSIRAALLYTEKGFKSNFGKASAGYVELPLQASYHIVTPTGVEFLLNVGPYFAYGISGKTQYEPEDLTFKYAYNQDSFGGKGFFKSFDMGVSAGIHVKLWHVLLGVNYEYGLTDVANVYGKFHNRNVAASLSWQF